MSTRGAVSARTERARRLTRPRRLTFPIIRPRAPRPSGLQARPHEHPARGEVAERLGGERRSRVAGARRCTRPLMPARLRPRRDHHGRRTDRAPPARRPRHSSSCPIIADRLPCRSLSLARSGRPQGSPPLPAGNPANTRTVSGAAALGRHRRQAGIAPITSPRKDSPPRRCRLNANSRSPSPSPSPPSPQPRPPPRPPPVPTGATWTQATIPSAGGVELHADILRPKHLPANAKTPVILSIGPYFNHSGQVGAAGPVAGRHATTRSARPRPLGPLLRLRRGRQADAAGLHVRDGRPARLRRLQRAASTGAGRASRPTWSPRCKWAASSPGRTARSACTASPTTA